MTVGEKLLSRLTSGLGINEAKTNRVTLNSLISTLLQKNLLSDASRKRKKINFLFKVYNFFLLFSFPILEGKVRSAGLLIASAEGFKLRPKFNLPFGPSNCFILFLPILGQLFFK